MWTVEFDDGERHNSAWPDRRIAEQIARGSSGARVVPVGKSGVTAHSLDITPDMRAAAMEGQPLFKKRTPDAPTTPPSPANPYRFIITQKQRAQVTAEIRQIAERVLGRRLVDVVAVDALPNGDDAQFDPNTGIIYVALQGVQDPRSSLRHEAIHLLRQAGVITAQEWAVLSRLARTRWMEQYDIRERYEAIYRERFDITPQQLEEVLIEEAIADAMAEHWGKVPAGDVVSRIFARVKAFLEAVRNMLRGQGFQTADQIMQRIEGGQMGQRAPGSGQGRGFMLYERQSSAPRDVTQTEAFKKWFGNSKVVDENGAPMVMFHGSAQPGIESFDPARANLQALWGPGFYFTDDSDVAGGTGGAIDDETAYAKAAFNMAGYAFQGRQFVAEPLTKRQITHIKRLFGGQEVFREMREDIGMRRNWNTGMRTFASLEQLGDPSQFMQWLANDAPRWFVDRIRAVKMQTTAPTVYPVYLSIKNPFDIERRLDREGAARLIDRIGRQYFGANITDGVQRSIARSFDGSDPVVTAGSVYLAFTDMQFSRAAINQALRRAGFDGITHIGGRNVGRETHRVFIAFEPEQIKSAIGNRGTFDPRNQSILASRGRQQPPRNPAPGSFDAPHDERVRRALFDSTDTLLNRIRRAGKAFSIEGLRKLQDREIDLLRTQMAIEEASGPISEPKNAYLAASLYPGRVAQRDRDLVEDFVEPLIEDIARRGLTLEEVDEFNMARHAFERNLEVGKLHKPGTQFHEAMTNPAIVGASGLSDDQASAILSRFQSQGKFADLEAIGDQIVDLNRRTLTNLLNEGLITQEQYDGLTAKYQYYVPLRGFDDVTDEANPDSPQVGRRFDTRGPEYQRAFGRTSKADSPLAYSIMQARQAIIRIEKNRVGKRFLRLAQQNPNEEFWQIDRVELKKIIDPNTGYVRNVFDRGAQEAENVFAVKVGGKRYNITLHHEGLLRAMKGIGGENMHGAFAFLHRITRFLAAVRTQYNPEFIFTNFMRDLQQAGIVLQEEDVAAITRKVIANLPKSMAGMNRMLNGDLSTVWARHAREFADAGGKIGFMERNDIEGEKRALEQLLSDANPSLGRKAWLKFMEHSIERIDRWNDVVENTMRLAAYVAMREAGASKDRAASVARELTVNFNRKGEWGPHMNALFMFFNASTQGMSNFALRLYRSDKLRKIFIGLMIYGFVQSMLNRMLGGDDDDDENRWDKIPMQEKQRNHIIMLPTWLEEQFGVPYFKIPAPLSWNLPMIIGMHVEHGVSGDLSPPDVGSHILGAFGDAFNPLGSGGTWANFITPTLGDPIVDIAQNRNFFGEQIVPRQFDETTPFAERHSPNVNPYAKWLTDTLASMTGGSPERPGAIDWSPEWVEHVFDFAFGGVGALFSRTSTTVDAIRQGEELDATKVPFARVFVGRDSRYADRDQYFQIRDAVHVTEKELEARMAEGNREAAARVREKHAREVAMIPFMKSAEKRMAKLRKDYKAVKNHLKMGEEAKKQRLDRLRKEMDDIQLKVRTRWNRLGEVGETHSGVGAN